MVAHEVTHRGAAKDPPRRRLFRQAIRERSVRDAFVKVARKGGARGKNRIYSARGASVVVSGVISTSIVDLALVS